MKPIVKYQGGKGRELPFIRVLKPKQFKTVIEPFAGGAAVAFGLNKPAVLNDTNTNVMNLYQVTALPGHFEELLRMVNVLKTKEHDELETYYYYARGWLNEQTNILGTAEIGGIIDRAYHYIVQRQLCFSGMERYNKDGEFNVPFGHYKSFSCNLSISHHNFLKECKLYGESFEKLDYSDTEGFYFIDPPYLERAGYGGESENLHEQLAKTLADCKGNWLLIHNDCEFYRDIYKDYNIVTQDFNYAQRFGKNKDHSGADVTHLYITNYDVDTSRLPDKKLSPKEMAQYELSLLIQDNNLPVDNSIISRLTGKQAEYITSIIE